MRRTSLVFQCADFSYDTDVNLHVELFSFIQVTLQVLIIEIVGMKV